MTALVSPTTDRWQSWAEMIEDFGGTAEMHGSGYWNLAGDPVPTEAGCAAFVAMTELTSSADLDGTRVPSTYLWIVDGAGGPDDALVGFLHLRHALDEFLFEQGGHIGYSVRPAARRRGHATAALGQAVTLAGRLGIERVLVTCDDDNEPSARVIEANAGVLEDVRSGRRRYWVDAPAYSGRSPGRSR